MLYPGTIFGIAAHVSGETAKAVSTAVLSMPASSFGKWSLVTDFGQVKDLYRTLKRGPYAHLRDNPMMAFWMKWRGWFGALMLTVLGWGVYTFHVKHLVEKGHLPICVESCPQRAIAFGPIDELRARYGANAVSTGLPDPALTKPNLVVGLPKV